MPLIEITFRYWLPEFEPDIANMHQRQDEVKWGVRSFERIGQALQEAEDHAVILHEANWGCPIICTLYQKPDTRMVEGNRLEQIRFRAECEFCIRVTESDEWRKMLATARDEWKPLEETLPPPDVRLSEQWTRLHLGELVQYCLACGGIGIDCYKGLCNKCMGLLEVPDRVRLTVSAQTALLERRYNREHRQILANMGAKAYREINGAGSFVRYTLPEWYQKEQREKYHYNRRGEATDRNGEPLPKREKPAEKKPTPKGDSTLSWEWDEEEGSKE